MTKTIEFYFDFGSPTVYLASTQLPVIAERNGSIVRSEYGQRLVGLNCPLIDQTAIDSYICHKQLSRLVIMSPGGVLMLMAG